jgi:hypothetical protein
MKTWFNLIRSHSEQTSNLGLLRLIAPLLTGVNSDELIESETIFDQLLSVILKSDYTDNFQVNLFLQKKSFRFFFLSYQFNMNFYVFVDFSLKNVSIN